MAPHQAARPDGLVQRVGQHARLLADRRHRQALIEQRLRLRQYRRRQLAPRPRLRRREKGGNTRRTIAFHAPLHGDRRHPEGPHNLALCRRAVDDQLRAEEPEGRQILAAVREHRQVPIEIDHLVFAALAGELIVDRRHADRK